MLRDDLDDAIHTLTDLPRQITPEAEARFQEALENLHAIREAMRDHELVAKANGVGEATLAVARALARKGVRPASDLLETRSQR